MELLKTRVVGQEVPALTRSTHALDASVIEAFCRLCDRAHELWLHHLELFDKNPRSDELMKSIARDEWHRLWVISQEYGLLQVIKLHDPAVMNGHFNLGIEYILEYGGWSKCICKELNKLAKVLRTLANHLVGARNKLLSHNDLATIVEATVLGEFPDGDDEQYFIALQEFVNVVHDQVIGGPYPFSTLVKNDIAFFLRTIKP